MDRGYRVADGQSCKWFAMCAEHGIGSKHESGHLQLGQGCKHGIDLLFTTGLQDMDLQAAGAGRCLQILNCESAVGLVGLMTTAKESAVGISSCRNSSRFGVTSTLKLDTPVTLPDGRFKAVDQSSRDWVGTHFEDNRYGCGRRFCGDRSRSAPRSDNHSHLTRD